MKTYLLLRDNHQSGPYTAEALQQMTLKKFDLIWVEGESIMWKYPSEIKEFHHFAPLAEITVATQVNNLKEMQMLYFQSCINEMDPATNISFLNQADALSLDIPTGYEYMIRAQNRKTTDAAAAKHQNNVEEEMAEEAVNHVKHMLGRSFEYTVLGASQIIDTPEVAANVYQFTSTIEMPVRYKRKEIAGKTDEDKKKKKVVPGITGLITLIAAALTLPRL